MEIIRVPGLNGLGNTEGCEKAGNEVVKELRKIYSNEKGKAIDTDALHFEEIHVNNSNLPEASELIYKNSYERHLINDKLAFLGGDHSISYSLVKGFWEYCKEDGKEPCLIVFDAHPDCMSSADSEIPTHEEWLKALVDSGFPAENVLVVGLRNSYPEESEFMKEKGIQSVDLNKFMEDLTETSDVLMEFTRGREVYVSIDVDVVDPAFTPGTGYKEPGGFTSREFLYVFHRINKIKNLKTIDIVEINPDKDRDNLTSRFSAKILSEFI
ncbi:MAG: arginase family protein [Candidatus Pacearchaeota archaeon]